MAVFMLKLSAGRVIIRQAATQQTGAIQVAIELFAPGMQLKRYANPTGGDCRLVMRWQIGQVIQLEKAHQGCSCVTVILTMGVPDASMQEGVRKLITVIVTSIAFGIARLTVRLMLMITA